MFLCEAVKKAMENGMAAKLPDELGCLMPGTVIIPTNTSDCCIMAFDDVEKSKQRDGRIYRRWNPTLEELLSDAWEVTDYIQSKDLRVVII